MTILDSSGTGLKVYGTATLEDHHAFTVRVGTENEWERRGLDFIRSGLPNHDPYRAWANFEFQTPDGAIYEVDLLVLTKQGFWLVEIKSWPGRVWGDPGTWTRTRDGKTISEDNPVMLANRKAKALISLLKSQQAVKKVRVPWLDALVFLSADNIQCDLTGPARNHVLLKDRPAEESRSERKGILAALLNRDGRLRLFVGSCRRFHLASGGQNAKSRGFLDRILKQDVDFDIIGQSYYPRWHGTLDDLKSNLTDLAQRYEQPIIVVEYSRPDIREINDIVRGLPDDKGLGTFIWEPTKWRGGALFDQHGKTRPEIDIYGDMAKDYGLLETEMEGASR